LPHTHYASDTWVPKSVFRVHDGAVAVADLLTWSVEGAQEQVTDIWVSPWLELSGL